MYKRQELARAEVSQAEQSSDARRLVVTKNRLGPCDIGSQDLAIDSSGVQADKWRIRGIGLRQIQEEIMRIFAIPGLHDANE